jgi:flagellar hook-associated protein 3 FlgL
MRVTQNSTANQVLANLQTIQTRQNLLEQYASTGVKVSSPGDDPTTAQQILHLKAQNSATDQYARNVTNATSTLSLSDSAMASMSDTLTRTKELALEMANGTNTADARTGAIAELQQLKNQMISLGNTQLNGKYIFGGFKNDTPPFDLTTGTFTGTSDNVGIAIDRSSSVDASYSGSALIAGGTPPGSSGTDTMKMYDDLIAAVNSGDSTQVQAQLGNIDSASSQVLTGRAVVGASMNRLTAATSVGDDQKLATSKVLTSLQDVDYLQVVSDLSKQQTAYQTAIAASARISQISLLDYLK